MKKMIQKLTTILMTVLLTVGIFSIAQKIFKQMMIVHVYNTV